VKFGSQQPGETVATQPNLQISGLPEFVVRMSLHPSDGYKHVVRGQASHNPNVLWGYWVVRHTQPYELTAPDAGWNLTLGV